jgi:uncharacterized protein with GYD domain
MPLYMFQFNYTPETWARLSKNPENRAETVKALVEKMGGRLVAFYYSFGEYDGVIITEMPDASTAAAASIGAIAAGHLKRNETTQLVTVDEGMEIMRKAGRATIQAPKG